MWRIYVIEGLCDGGRHDMGLDCDIYGVGSGLPIAYRNAGVYAFLKGSSIPPMRYLYIS